MVGQGKQMKYVDLLTIVQNEDVRWRIGSQEYERKGSRSSKVLAEKLNVSPRVIEKTRAMLDHGTPEIRKDFSEGKISLESAYQKSLVERNTKRLEMEKKRGSILFQELRTLRLILMSNRRIDDSCIVGRFNKMSKTLQEHGYLKEEEFKALYIE